MAQIFATLHSRDNVKQPDLQLPLSLQAPDKEQLDLTVCPLVYENGHYDLKINIDLNALNKALQEMAPEQMGLGFEDERSSAPRQNRYLSLTAAEDADDEDDDFGDESDDDFFGESDSQKARSYSIINAYGNFKRVIDVKLSINSQVRASFNFDLTQPAHLVQGIAVFHESSASGNNQPFLLQYDAIYLSFIVKFSDGYRIPLYSRYLLCASNNAEENQNINQILHELTEIDNDYILDLMFKNQQRLVEKPSERSDFSEYTTHRSYKSLNSYVTLLETVLECYKNNFLPFRALAKHIIVKNYAVLPFDKVRTITHKSNHWLGQNLDVLMAVNSDIGTLEYNHTSYIPLKMQSEVNQKSYDTFENRVVMGFLKMVLHNANKIYNEYKSFVTAHQSHLDANKDLFAQGKLIQAQQQRYSAAASAPAPAGAANGYINMPTLSAHNGRYSINSVAAEGTSADSGSTDAAQYQAPIITLKYAQLGLYHNALRRIQELIGELNAVYINYAKIFKLPEAILRSFPRKAKAFQEIKPYAQVFQSIMSWFRYGDFSLEKDMLFLNVNTLDKIYEYYCLYRLLDMLIANGFKPCQKDASYTYNYQVDGLVVETDPFVANTYNLERGQQKVTVYYQPVISTNRFENGIYAYRTTHVTKRKAFNSGDSNFYCPDFILRFNSGERPGDDDYLIFDAKFSQGKTIISQHIGTLFKKYGMETSIAVFRPTAPAALANATAADAADADATAPVTTHAAGSVYGAMPRYLALPDDDDIFMPRENYLYNSEGRIIQREGDHKGREGFEFVGCKVPKMIFALQGRINSPRPRPIQRPRYNAYPNTMTPQWKIATKQHSSHIWFYHNSSLAHMFPPNISVGVVEMNTKADSAPELWKEIMRNLPYLQQTQPAPAQESSTSSEA